MKKQFVLVVALAMIPTLTLGIVSFIRGESVSVSTSGISDAHAESSRNSTSIEKASSRSAAVSTDPDSLATPSKPTTVNTPQKTALRPRTLQHVLLAYLSPANDSEGISLSQAGVTVRSGDTDGSDYFTLRLITASRLLEAEALFDELTITYNVIDPAKGVLLLSAKKTADFATLDKRIGESGLFLKNTASTKK